MIKQVKRHCFHSRGVALVTVVGLMLVLLIFAGGLMTQLAMEVNSVKQHGASATALAAADAGVHGMLAKIQDNAILNLAPPPSITYNYPEATGPSTISYTATIQNQWQSGQIQYYLIESTGIYNNGLEHQQRIVRAIARAQPYARYASFSIYEVNKWGNPVWYRFDQTFGGPVYSGGPMRIDYQDGMGPIFTNGVTTLNTPIWAPGAPGSIADWTAVSNGQSNFTIDSTPLQLPQPNSDIVVASEAWEGDNANTFSSGFPSVAPGLYINQGNAATGNGQILTGIYINANGPGPGHNVIINGSSSGSTETFTFTSPVKGFGPPYTVTIDFGAMTTTVVQGANRATYSGVPSGEPGPGITNTGNGAIFVYGNVVFGSAKTPDVTIQGDYTFATPDYSGSLGTITLLGNFKYNDKTKDKVALWADDVYVQTLASNIEIDASIIAGFPGEAWSDGNFSNIFCTRTNCGAKNQGTLTLDGGIIENDRGALGEWVGGTHTGFSRVINYDSRLSVDPPPFNPTTGAFNLIAWDDIGS